jgi:hypothetical protein
MDNILSNVRPLTHLPTMVPCELEEIFWRVWHISCFPLPEDGSRIGSRKLVFHRKQADWESQKKEDYFSKVPRMCFAGTNRYISFGLPCCNTYIERDLETATRSTKDAQNTLLQRAKRLIEKQRLFIADAKWTRPVRVGPHRQQLLLCSESSGFNEAVLQTSLA